MDASATVLTPFNAGPALFGQTLTFTATVTGGQFGSGTPTGTVQFKDGSTVLASQQLANGSTVLITSALAPGNHTLTAFFVGSAGFVRVSRSRSSR